MRDDKLHITDEYIWLPELHVLPVTIRLQVRFGKKSDEFLPCFSANRVEWGEGECDALSWYLSPHRHDFTFRTNLFEGFPEVKRFQKGKKAALNRDYQMTCTIRETNATYWIDGKRYARATYAAGTVPREGYLGFAIFEPEDITVWDIQVAPAKAPRSRARQP